MANKKNKAHYENYGFNDNSADGTEIPVNHINKRHYDVYGDSDDVPVTRADANRADSQDQNEMMNRINADTGSYSNDRWDYTEFIQLLIQNKISPGKAKHDLNAYLCANQMMIDANRQRVAARREKEEADKYKNKVDVYYRNKTEEANNTAKIIISRAENEAQRIKENADLKAKGIIEHANKMAADTDRRRDEAEIVYDDAVRFAENCLPNYRNDVKEEFEYAIKEANDAYNDTAEMIRKADDDLDKRFTGLNDKIAGDLESFSDELAEKLGELTERFRKNIVADTIKVNTIFSHVKYDYIANCYSSLNGLLRKIEKDNDRVIGSENTVETLNDAKKVISESIRNLKRIKSQFESALSRLGGIETRISEKGTYFDKYDHMVFEADEDDEAYAGRRILRTVTPGLVEIKKDETGERSEEVILREEVILE